MFIYSTSIAPVLVRRLSRLRPLLGHMLVDQNYATTMTRGRFRDDVDVIPYYIGLPGSRSPASGSSRPSPARLLGPFIPASWGLDFAVPLVFLAMLAPALKDRAAVEVAVVTGVAAAVLVPLLPMQTGLIVAMLAGHGVGRYPASAPAPRREARRPARRAPAEEGRRDAARAPSGCSSRARARHVGDAQRCRSCCTATSPCPRGRSGCCDYVPVAALTALVVPGALYLHHDSVYSFAPARLDRGRHRDAGRTANQKRRRDPGRRHGRAVGSAGTSRLGASGRGR